MHKKGISPNSVEKSLSHSADKIRRRTLLCFERILVSKSFKQRRGEASRFCRNFFYLTGPKKLRQGTILCFRKFLVEKNILWIRGGGGIMILNRSFCHTVPKYFIGEHFGVSEKFFYRKFSCIGGGGASRFCRNFLSHRTETKSFVKEPFCFPEFFWYRKKFMDKRGLITIFSRHFMSHSAENFRKGILLFLKKILVSKSFMDEKGVSRFSVENFWSPSAEKFRGHPFNVSENLRYRKNSCIIGGITIFRLRFFVSQCRKTSYRNPLVLH